MDSIFGNDSVLLKKKKKHVSTLYLSIVSQQMRQLRTSVLISE